MTTTRHPIPSAAEVRERLQPLSLKQLEQLGTLSGVPPTTIYKIQRGETKNPGIETVRDFWPHVAAVLRAPRRRATDKA